MTKKGRQLYVGTIGEVLVEIMRPTINTPLYQSGTFLGPYPSGAPAIFIDAIAKLGLPAGIVGCVGNDDFGKCITDRLKTDGVDVAQVEIRDDSVTGVAFVTYFDSGDRQFLFHIADSAAGTIRLDQRDRNWLEKIDIFHLSGSAMGINEDVRLACYEAVQVVKQCGGIVTFDPNTRLERFTRSEIEQLYVPLLSYCDYVFPSAGEAELITGLDTLNAAVVRLFELGVKAVVCKRGAEGCTLYTPDTQMEVPAFKVEVVDPTGAGDCFCAGVVYGLAQQWNWQRTLTFGNAMGALATRKQGPMEGTVSLSGVIQFIKETSLDLSYNFE